MRRIRKRHFALSVIFALAVYVVQELTRPEIYGMAAGIDGDTLEIDGQRIRLYGIDTPERRQTCQNAASIPYPCGQTAADFLREAMDGRPLRCVVMDHDRYSRLAARCFAGDTSVNAQLVRAGWALAYTDYSWRYVLDEHQARAARAGMWAGRFQAPWDFRHGKNDDR